MKNINRVKDIVIIAFICFIIGNGCTQNEKYNITKKGYVTYISYNSNDIKDSTAKNYYNKGIELRDKGDNEKSLKYFLKADSIESGNIDITNSVALSYCRNDNLDSCILWFEKSLSIDYTYIPTYSAYGWSLNHFGQFNQAIMIMETGLSIDNTDPIPGILFTNIACSYYAKDDYETALNYINKAIKSSDDTRITESFINFKKEINSKYNE